MCAIGISKKSRRKVWRNDGDQLPRRGMDHRAGADFQDESLLRVPIRLEENKIIAKEYIDFDST